MHTLDFLLNKYNIPLSYIEIPNIGRDELAVICSELNFKTGIEIGVAAGEFSEVLVKGNKWTKFYGVDPYVKYEGYKDYQLQSTFERMRNETKKRTVDHPEYSMVEKFSISAAKLFEDSSVDFIYIDGNHSGESVREDIETWYPKLKRGGIMAGHDFTNRWPSLKKEVISFCERKETQLFVLGMERKDLELYRDVSRSWMFVKE